MIVLPDMVAPASEGGIEKPEMVIDQEQQAQTRGTLVAVGGMAFCDWEGS